MMRFIFLSAVLSISWFACNSDSNTELKEKTAMSHSNKNVLSVKNSSGKYPVDENTASGLHRFENSLTNFRDIARKRKSPIEIYNEFSIVVTRDVESITTDCCMTGDGKEVLQNILHKISTENEVLKGIDLDKARSSFQNILVSLHEINHLFDDNN